VRANQSRYPDLVSVSQDGQSCECGMESQAMQQETRCHDCASVSHDDKTAWAGVPGLSNRSQGARAV